MIILVLKKSQKTPKMAQKSDFFRNRVASPIIFSFFSVISRPNGANSAPILFSPPILYSNSKSTHNERHFFCQIWISQELGEIQRLAHGFHNFLIFSSQGLPIALLIEYAIV